MGNVFSSLFKIWLADYLGCNPTRSIGGGNCSYLSEFAKGNPV